VRSAFAVTTLAWKRLVAQGRLTSFLDAACVSEARTIRCERFDLVRCLRACSVAVASSCRPSASRLSI